MVENLLAEVATAASDVANAAQSHFAVDFNTGIILRLGSVMVPS